MAKVSKTNFISYEIKQLEEYFKQLNRFLKKNPPDLAEDRVEHLSSPKGIPIIKVIASREAQIKLFTETLEKLPKILNDLNTLRKSVDGQEQVNVRGDSGIPGFMDSDDADDDKEEYIEQKPAATKVKFEDDEEFDKKEAGPDYPKQLPSPKVEQKLEEKIYDFSGTDSLEDDDIWDEDLEDE